ncbi:hypothetical protein [Chamaesiphon sp.]|uniref:hypothetical protein n=1 Tax=Chamaesiphon sp. TaxID=2814140 RepID=UPI0035933758
MTETNNRLDGVSPRERLHQYKTSDSADSIAERLLNFTAEELAIVGYFARGQKHSISSQNLKLEYTETSIRLSDRDGKLIGISKQVNKWQRKVLVSNNSSYREIIIEDLIDLGLINRQKSSHPEFTEHHEYQLPDGYKLNYTEAIELWKIWWNNRRYQLNNPRPAIDVLTFSRGNWYPIDDLQPKQGAFVLTTARGEIQIDPEEYVVWLDPKSPKFTGADANSSSSPSALQASADLLGSLEPRSNRQISTEVPSPSARLSGGRSIVPPATLMGESVQNIDIHRPRIAQLPELEELDLEAYLNTFNTEDTEDVDRIEGIYHIGELLSGTNIIDPPLPKPPNSPQTKASVPLVEPPATTAELDELTLAQQQASLKLKAMKVLITYLQEGDRVIRTEVLKNALGQEINRKIVKTERGCPSWAIEQVRHLTAVDR